jgi:hypothetical protein
MRRGATRRRVRTESELGANGDWDETLLGLAQVRGAGGIFRARSALPTCEARFQLHNRAGLRGRFRARWAGLREQNRANKHLQLG